MFQNHSDGRRGGQNMMEKWYLHGIMLQIGLDKLYYLRYNMVDVGEYWHSFLKRKRIIGTENAGSSPTSPTNLKRKLWYKLLIVRCAAAPILNLEV